MAEVMYIPVPCPIPGQTRRQEVKAWASLFLPMKWAAFLLFGRLPTQRTRTLSSWRKLPLKS